jgi:UDP-N-acetylglucosamine--N-acetylmuramyl-(pentapeptide) pyrophosphoryl-undecaprenol N-acetylglucosamine transferase
MLVVLTGGGTGGHLSIVKALKVELKKRGATLYYIGSTKGQDRKWFESDSDFDSKLFLDTKGVVNQSFFGKIASIYKILESSIMIIRFILKHRVQKVISVGGFSAAPASIASILTKRDFYIHEQNSVIGSLNRLLRPFAKEFFSSYIKDSTLTSYPINKEFFDKSRDRVKIESIIFIGGSQGAVAINNFALTIAKTLNEKGIKIIHQTGERDYQRVKDEYEKMQIDVDVFDFSSDLVDKISQADFAISRAGAGTLWELCANRVPTLFIPYPYAAKNHQYYNAKFLVDRDLALLCKESDLSENILTNILEFDIEKVSKELKKEILPNGVEEIVDIVYK